MDRDRALQLAAKLLNMDAAKGCTPEEAANAAARLSALMDEHNLDMLSVQAEQQRSNIGEERYGTAWKRMPRWVQPLVNAVCKSFRCHPIVVHSSNARTEIRIVGDKTEAALARYFLAYLIDQLPRAFTAFSLTPMGDAIVTFHGAAQARASFIIGAASAVYERLVKMHQEWIGGLDATKREQARGLVVVRGAAIKAFVANNYPSLYKRRSDARVNPAAAQAGYEHGKSMNLSRGLRGDAGGGAHLTGG